MEHISIQDYASPFGELILGSFKNRLVLCDWKHRKQRASIDQRIKKQLNSNFQEASTEIIEETKLQLSEFFDSKRQTFEIDYQLIGTDFQQQVWNQLLKIPFGTTTSYLQLSNQLNNPKAIRAVASANGANALSILVPCHRVIGENGSLIGYAGGLNAKKRLLQLENPNSYTQIELF